MSAWQGAVVGVVAFGLLLWLLVVLALWRRRRHAKRAEVERGQAFNRAAVVDAQRRLPMRRPRW